jgi:hypothetical protein
MRPGLTYEPLVTRSWNIILTDIDGIKAGAEGSSAEWLAWVNEKFIGRTVDADEGMPDERKQQIVEAVTLQVGDAILLKLTTGPDKP